jgi:iron complex transport system permease protein
MTSAPIRTSWITVRLPLLRLSFRIDKRVPLVLAIVLGLIIVVALLNLTIGSFPISPIDALKTVFRLESANPDHNFVVNQLRLPRTVGALLVGMALGISGAILQGLTRNALASPDIMGVSAGASITVVAAIIAIPTISVTYYPLAAMVGAFVAAGIIYLLAWQRGGASPVRLILVGIAVNAVAGAITSILITFGEIKRVGDALLWLAGSVNGTTWEHIGAALPWIVVLFPLVMLNTRGLNVLNLGDSVAVGLGAPVERQRLILLFSGVALAAMSVSVAGTVGFVGLMAPHIARQLVGPSHEGVIPISALIGGLIVLAADTVGRNLFAPQQIPAGIFTAILGVPYFLYLLYRNRDRW